MQTFSRRQALRAVLGTAAGAGAVYLARGGRAQSPPPGLPFPPETSDASARDAAPVSGASLPAATGLPFHRYLPALAEDGYPPPPPPPPPAPPPIPPLGYDAPAVFYRGDPNVPRVYLTLDDCYSPSLVRRAMDIAGSYGAHLTFFPVGSLVGQHPDLWREVLARGHAVENHTYSHSFLSRLSDAQVRNEISWGWSAIEAAVGKSYRPRFLRPPGGDGIFNYDARIPRIAGDLGFKVCMWSADSNGWRLYPRSDSAAVNTVLRNVFKDFRAGSVVLQHVLEPDISALPAILAEAGRRGLQCSTLQEGIR